VAREVVDGSGRSSQIVHCFCHDTFYSYSEFCPCGRRSFRGRPQAEATGTPAKEKNGARSDGQGLRSMAHDSKRFARTSVRRGLAT